MTTILKGRPKKSTNFISKKVFLETSTWDFLGREANNLSRLTGQHISMAQLIRMSINNEFKSKFNV
ncbi:hypothetical protein OAI36_00475 [Alphaproteobacteria bacterium]|nr:hypothetical protein [Alphaproteobacteria bacterium]